MIAKLNSILRKNSPLLPKEGAGVVQSFSTNASIYAHIIKKPLLSGHAPKGSPGKDTKTRSTLEVFASKTTPLREPSCPRVFVVKKQRPRIFEWIFSNDLIRNRYLLRSIPFFFLSLLPLLLPAQTSQFFVQQGLLHYELQEYNEAIHNFEMALQYPNPQRDVYMYITSSHLLNEDYEAAIRLTEEGLEVHPGFIRLKVMKGEALIQTDLKKAIPVFEEVFEEIKQTDAEQVDGIRKKAVGQYISRLYQQVAAEAFEKDDLKTAASQYRKARQFDTEDISIQNNLAFILIQLKEWEEADSIVKQALRKFPDSENLLLMQAQIYEHRENADELLNTLENLYQTDPSYMNRAVMYGRALLSANRANEANTFFKDKIDTYPKERILYKTLLDINRQRFNQSGVLEVLRMQMEQFPGEVELEEEYGLELITARNYQEANAWFDSLAVVYNEPEFGRLAAHSWLFDEDIEQAEAEYRKQLERWPGQPLLMGEFGRVLIENGKIEEARDVLQTVLEKHDDEHLRYLYASHLPTQSEKESALEPLFDTLYHGRAQWLLFKGSDENWRQVETANVYDILVKLLEFVEQRQKMVRSEAQAGLETFRTAAPPLFQSAAELREAGDEVREMLQTVRKKMDFGKSSHILITALSAYPESALLMHHKGELYYENGLSEQAKSYLLESAELEIYQVETHFVLGQIYWDLDQFDNAVLSFERVLSLDPQHRQAYRSLIRIHHQKGDMEQLSSRWLQRYQHQKRNEVLREFLIEALHRSSRFEEARAVLK